MGRYSFVVEDLHLLHSAGFNRRSLTGIYLWGGLYHLQELYHLQDDPGELVNLAEVEPERVRALRLRLRPWIEQGALKKGDAMHLDDAARAQLRPSATWAIRGARAVW